jgi:hypothetical protein
MIANLEALLPGVIGELTARGIAAAALHSQTASDERQQIRRIARSASRRSDVM